MDRINDYEYLWDYNYWDTRIDNLSGGQFIGLIFLGLIILLVIAGWVVQKLWPTYEVENYADEESFASDGRIILALEDESEFTASNSDEEDVIFYKTNIPGFLLVAKYDDDKNEYIPVGAVTREVPTYEQSRRIYGPNAPEWSMTIQSAGDAMWNYTEENLPRWYIVGEPKISFPDAVCAGKALVNVIDTYRLPGERISPKYEIVIERNLEKDWYAQFEPGYFGAETNGV